MPVELLEPDPVELLEPDPVELLDPELVALDDGVRVRVTLDVPLRLAVALDEEVTVCVVVPLAVTEAVCDELPVVVTLGVWLAVVDAEAVALEVLEKDDVDDGEIRDARLRPWYTGTRTPPSAASQAPSADSLMPPLQPLEGISWVMFDKVTHIAFTTVEDAIDIDPSERSR